MNNRFNPGRDYRNVTSAGPDGACSPQSINIRIPGGKKDKVG